MMDARHKILRCDQQARKQHAFDALHLAPAPRRLLQLLLCRKQKRHREAVPDAWRFEHCLLHVAAAEEIAQRGAVLPAAQLHKQTRSWAGAVCPLYFSAR